MLVAEQ
jgi:hypothetical protein